LEKEPAPICTIKPMTPPGLDPAIRRYQPKDPEERANHARRRWGSWASEGGPAAEKGARSVRSGSEANGWSRCLGKRSRQQSFAQACQRHSPHIFCSSPVTARILPSPEWANSCDHQVLRNRAKKSNLDLRVGIAGRQSDKHRRSGLSFWSPDGKWIDFSQTAS
jgi:hypothetical protein